MFLFDDGSENVISTLHKSNETLLPIAEKLNDESAILNIMMNASVKV